MDKLSRLNDQVGGDHYIKCGMQPVEYAFANKLDFFQGSIIKYITRWRDKGGVQDLRKAEDCLAKYIYFVEKEGSS